jgi:hypothetical protein
VIAERGQLIERPRLPSWMPLVLTVLLGGRLLAVVAFGLLVLGRPTPPPTIARFDVSSTQVARGDVVNLSWAASNVNALNLNVNGTPVLTNAGGQSSGVPLDTDNLIGSVALELVGVGGEQQTIATQTVYVYEPLGEGFFTTTPTQLVRYVVQSLDISWEVPGAVQTRLTGLEAFSQAPIEPSFGSEVTLTGISGIPTSPFTLTLHAEDELGHTREQTLNIQVVNPECSPARGDVTLRAGPDARHQVVGTVPAGAAVVVDAQDSSGRWLRIQLPGGQSGWGVRSQFTCSSIFNPDALYKEVNVPTLPPPTATLTRTPQPTKTPRAATGTPSG